ncbi:MAG: hypothetical protein PVI90_07670 [Desulfobacteraceae bacterium]|jgi:hypothetical protein
MSKLYIFIDALLSCQTICDVESRNTLIDLLPDDIKNNFNRNSKIRIDVTNLINRCLKVKGGIESLVDNLRFLEGDSQPMREVYNMVVPFLWEHELSVSRELLSELLFILPIGKLDLKELEKEYRRSLPESAKPKHNDPTCWQIVEHLANFTLQDDKTYPLLQFVQRIADGLWPEDNINQIESWIENVKSTFESNPTGLTDILPTRSTEIPADLTNLVIEKITKELSKPRPEMLQKCLSTALKEKYQISARSPSEIASKLVKVEIKEILMTLLLTRRDVVNKMREDGKSDREIGQVRKSILNIVGWLVLSAVNIAWLAKNRKDLYPQEFPGAIVLPVKTNSGIEIIHAAIEKRSAQFYRSEGKLFGAARIPAMDHDFMEEGFESEDIIHAIKTIIYMHINRKRGIREQVPKNFTEDVDKKFNDKLQTFYELNKNVYLVVKRRSKGCPVNNDIYMRLKSDLPDLRVVFHESKKAEDVFKVDEIILDSKLESIFENIEEA